MQTQEADGWSLRCLFFQKGVGKRMVVYRQKVKTSSESTRYRRSGQAEWSGRREWSPKNRQGSKLGGLAKRRVERKEYERKDYGTKHAG